MRDLHAEIDALEADQDTLKAELATVKKGRDALKDALVKIMKASNPPEGAAWYRAVARLALLTEGGEG